MTDILAKTSNVIDSTLPITHAHCLVVFNFGKKDALQVSFSNGISPEVMHDVLRRATEEIGKHIGVNDESDN